LALAGDGGTGGGVAGTDLDLALVVVPLVGVVEVAVVQEIDVSVVLDAGVPAVLVVDVLVTVMAFAAHDRFLRWTETLPSFYGSHRPTGSANLTVFGKHSRISRRGLRRTTKMGAHS